MYIHLYIHFFFFFSLEDLFVCFCCCCLIVVYSENEMHCLLVLGNLVVSLFCFISFLSVFKRGKGAIRREKKLLIVHSVHLVLQNKLFLPFGSIYLTTLFKFAPSFLCFFVYFILIMPINLTKSVSLYLIHKNMYALAYVSCSAAIGFITPLPYFTVTVVLLPLCL